MKPFKFLRNPIAKAHDGGDIYAGEVFYTMNKEDFPSIKPGRIIPKYTIVRRMVSKKFQEIFIPDYEVLWYFRSRENAEYLKRIWEREDRTNGGDVFFNQSDIIVTFSGSTIYNG